MPPPRALERTSARLSERDPVGRRALISAVVWLLVAALATRASIWVAIHVTSSVALRILGALILVAIGTTALMLASDSVERALDGRLRGWGGRVQWLTTSIVALSLVVASGVVLSSVAPDRPGVGNVALDFLIDLVVGAGLGAVAIGLTLGVAAALGHVIWLAARLMGAHRRAQRWQRSPQAENRRLREVGRGAALGSAGLLLSALCSTLVTSLTTNHNGAADTPAPHEASFVLTVVMPVVFWFVGTGLVWLLFARPQRQTFKPHHRFRHGTHASAISICLVMGAAWIATAGLESHAHRVLWSGPAGPVPTISITDRQASPQSSYLARKFEPELLLTSAEHWTPTAVTWYVQRNLVPNTDPPFCNAHPPGRPPPGCYEISSSCDVADPGPRAVSGADDPAVYYRYVDPANASPEDRSPSATANAWTLIQYWVFYNYDSLHTWASPSGIRPTGSRYRCSFAEAGAPFVPWRLASANTAMALACRPSWCTGPTAAIRSPSSRADRTPTTPAR
jgi:MFS family permease